MITQLAVALWCTQCPVALVRPPVAGAAGLERCVFCAHPLPSTAKRQERPCIDPRCPHTANPLLRHDHILSPDSRVPPAVPSLSHTFLSAALPVAAAVSSHCCVHPHTPASQSMPTVHRQAQSRHLLGCVIRLLGVFTRAFTKRLCTAHSALNAIDS